MNTWKTAKIFISSTFKDLEIERDSLVNVFRDMQKHVFDRRLHIIPYDLRWQNQRSPNLVRWCLNKILECNYFIGILNNRYGWCPPHDYSGKENDKQLSITEMEVHCALESIPKENRFFCFSDNTIRDSMSNIDAVSTLKKYLKEKGEDIVYYSCQQDLQTIIEARFKQMLDRDFLPIEKITLENYSYEEALQEIIAEKRNDFVGRDKYTELLQAFCDQSKQNVLVIEGVAGSGKSALVSEFLYRHRQNQHLYIGHYMSMNTNKDMYTLLQSIAMQLERAGIIENVEKKPAELADQVAESLSTATKPFLLCVDGVDEMENTERLMAWFPHNISPHIHIILTSRQGIKWNLAHDFQKIQLENMTEQEILSIISIHKNKHHLDFSSEQEKTLIERSQGNPLYLKVALEEMVLGGVAVGQLAENIDALFLQVLERLQATHGNDITNDYLGLIAASSNGLAEAELSECLMEKHSIEICNTFLLQANDGLSSFVVMRQKVFQFFHVEFETSVKMMLGKAKMRDYHRTLAHYFKAKGYKYERCLEQLPFQLQWGELYEEVIRTFCDLDFLQAKCNANMIVNLCRDLEFATTTNTVPLPESLQVELATDVFANKKHLCLLQNALNINSSFIIDYPDELFSCLWNHCYWYDCPEAEKYYTESGNFSGENLYKIALHWRNKMGNKSWLESVSPFPNRLGASLQKALKANEAIRCIAISSDGKFIAGGSKKGDIFLWEARSGKCVKTFIGHMQDITSIQIVADRLVSASFDGTIRIYDLYNGETLLVLEKHCDVVTDIAVYENKIISVSKDHSVIFWNMDDGNVVCKWELPESIYSLGIDKNNDMVVLGGEANIYLWDIKQNKQIWALPHKDEANTIFIYNEIIYCAGNKINAWNYKGEHHLQLIGHTQPIHSLCLSQDNKILFSGSFDNTIIFWDLEKRERLHKLNAHDNWISGLAVYENLLYSSSWDGSIKIWNSNIYEPTLHLKGHQKDIENIIISKDDQHILSLGADYKAIVWNCEDGQMIHSIPRQKGHFENIAINDDASILVSTGGDSGTNIQLWDVNKKQMLSSTDTKHSRIITASLSGDGRRIALGNMDGSILFSQTEEINFKYSLKGHTKMVRCLDLNHDGSILVSASTDQTIRIWNTKEESCITTINSEETVETLYFDNEQINGLSNSFYYVWDMNGNLLDKNSKKKSESSKYYTIKNPVSTTLKTIESNKEIASFSCSLQHTIFSKQTDIMVGYENNHLYVAKIQIQKT